MPCARRILSGLTPTRLGSRLLGGDAVNGNVLQLWECNGQDSQNWQTTQFTSLQQTQQSPRTRQNDGNRSLVREPWVTALMRRAHIGVAEARPVEQAASSSRSSVSVEAMPNAPSAAGGRPWHERVAAWYAQQSHGIYLPKPLANVSATNASLLNATPPLLRYRLTTFVHRPDAHVPSVTSTAPLPEPTPVHSR